MVDKIERPQPPVEWDLPDAADDLGGPDKSFNDDAIAARLKTEEAARGRLAQERLVTELPKDILTSQEKVQRAGPKLQAGEDELARRAQQDRRAGSATGDDSIAQRQGSDAQSLDRAEERMEKLFANMRVAEEIGDKHQDGPRQLVSDTRLARLELQIKLHFQHLVAGGVGFSLLGDPRLAFRRLFDRLGHWPRRVRPGRRPETDQEFDAFLSWIFEPPAPPEEDSEPLHVFK